MLELLDKEGFEKNFTEVVSGNNSGKFLIGVSGGIDSMVLLHLASQLKMDLTVLHCNFGLRGKESDLDEALTAKVAEEYGLVFKNKKFDTIKYADENRIDEPGPSPTYSLMRVSPLFHISNYHFHIALSIAGDPSSGAAVEQDTEGREGYASGDVVQGVETGLVEEFCQEPSGHDEEQRQHQVDDFVDQGPPVKRLEH